MDIKELSINSIKPYANNPRRNDGAVDAVAASIKEFGFQQPLVIDRNGVIVVGHTRFKAAKKLGYKTVPCVVADDLTEEQINAYRLADNKTNELAEWDAELLEAEIKDLPSMNMAPFGFEYATTDDWFESREKNDKNTDGESEDYQEFVEKFEAKKTTDDCYTPPLVFDAIKEWVIKEYKINPDLIVRPFKPGGDYQKERYAPNAVVLDNPPFSILSEIVRFYTERSIRFFLFAPTLTLLSRACDDCCTALACGVGVIYENGANVNTSFLTNLEPSEIKVKSCPELYEVIHANSENIKSLNKAQRKYEYPNEVITASMVVRFSKYGVNWQLNRPDCVRVSQLDSQKENGDAIYGGGYLISDQATSLKLAATEQVENNKMDTELKRLQAIKSGENVLDAIWELSPREIEIVRGLGNE